MRKKFFVNRFLAKKLCAVLELSCQKSISSEAEPFHVQNFNMLAPYCQTKGGTIMYGVIYLITNLLDGKKYVGQTTRTSEQRFKEHANCKTSLIGKAIRKYGVKNFSVKVLEECNTSEQLNEREKFWITQFDCKVPNGYNQTDGGHNGQVHTPEARAKISEANIRRKRKKLSDETRKKIQLATKKYWAKVHRHEKTRHNVSRPRMRIWGDIYPILEAEFQKKSITISKLVEVLGLSDTEICRKMHGKRKFSVAQMTAIKNFLGVEMNIDELFRRQTLPLQLALT